MCGLKCYIVPTDSSQTADFYHDAHFHGSKLQAYLFDPIIEPEDAISLRSPSPFISLLAENENVDEIQIREDDKGPSPKTEPRRKAREDFMNDDTEVEARSEEDDKDDKNESDEEGGNDESSDEDEPRDCGWIEADRSTKKRKWKQKAQVPRQEP
jgi:hypothetical protein